MAYEILESPQSEFEIAQFAKLPSIKGSQFGKDTYSTMIKFKDLDKFLKAFPDVQRTIIPRKVSSLRTYILSGLDKKDVRLRFFSAVTCSARGSVYFDEHSNTVAIDTAASLLSINDGQHRVNALSSVIKQLEKDYFNTKKKARAELIRMYINELNEMSIPVVIFAGLSEGEEKGLFHDLNNLAQRPSRNTNIMMSQTDYIAKLAREISVENKYLKHYGVELEKMSISRKNENTFLLATIYECVKELYRMEYQASNKRFINAENFDSYKTKTDNTFNTLFYHLPGDLNIKNKYMFDKAFILTAICRFIHNSRLIGSDIKEAEAYEVIKAMDWTYNLSYWEKYGAHVGISGKIIFSQSATATHQIYTALMDKVEEMYS